MLNKINLNTPTIFSPKGFREGKEGYVNVFKAGKTFMADKSEIVEERHDLFHRIFEGKKVKQKVMFNTIKYFSPSGLPKELPMTETNVKKYNNFVRKKRYHEELYQKYLNKVA